MLRSLRSTRRMPLLLILGACLLLLGAIPPRPIGAAIRQEEINNALEDFKNGRFQRTSLSTALNTAASTRVPDRIGAVQLGPIGLLKGWFPSPYKLKKPLIRMGATSIGNRIYVIGGSTNQNFASVPLAEVWSAAVSQTNGEPTEDWRAEPALPAVRGSDRTSPDFTTPIAEIVSPAVTSITTNGNAHGYIYVIGGNAKKGTFTFSSYAVRIGTVVNGQITGWAEQVGARIPGPTGCTACPEQLGVQSAIALNRTINGTTYVYLIGGLQRYIQGANQQESGSRAVFFARVGAQGKLFKPSSPGTEGWDKTQDIPPVTVPPGSESVAGLWDAAGVADNFVASTQLNADAIYVMGGQVTPNQPPVAPTFTEKVQRAQINSDGTLNWDWDGILPTTRYGSGAVPFRGNIYMTGGIPAGSAESDRAVLTSYIEDDLTLHLFSSTGIEGDGSNFLKSDALPVNNPRTFHGTTIVAANPPAGSNSPNAAFVYVLGGLGATDANPGDDQGSDTVIYGRIGTSEDISSTGYASDGWFYSQPFSINFNQAQVQQINWTTLISRTGGLDMDIQVDYSLSTSNDCTNATWQDWTSVDGAPSDVDHSSINGQNEVTLNNFVARCFRYRARLSSNDRFSTPALLNLSIQIFIPGNPDIWVNNLAAQRGAGNSLTGLTVTIRNESHAPNTDPITLDTRDGGRNPAGGSFFVDLFIFGPNPGTVTPPGNPPLPNPPGSKAYANVNYNQLPANTSFTITQWKDSGNDLPTDIRQYFSQPGQYKVYVVVDSFDDVNEGTLGGENNNVSSELVIDVPSIGYAVGLPLVSR